MVKDVQLPSTCPKGHLGIKLLSTEKLDYIDSILAKDNNGKSFSMKMYSGHALIDCRKCHKEYDVKCEIYER